MNPIILALDMPDLNQAREMLSLVRDFIGMIKIGPELWAAHGSAALTLGNEFNIPMFLDLKLHDIPNTVMRTVEVLVAKSNSYSKIAFLTVHAMGGKEMMEGAVSVAHGSGVEIAAVTLLTSMDKKDMWSIGMSGTAGTKTCELANLAKQSGIKTFVTSPQNIALMRENVDEIIDLKAYRPITQSFTSTLICPGIRSSSAPEDDQKRTKPIGFAIRQGADYVVIGRPITHHHDPATSAREFLAQVEKART